MSIMRKMIKRGMMSGKAAEGEPAPETGVITFQGGFDPGVVYDVYGSAGNWTNAQMTATRISLATDIVRKGVNSARIEVRSGDVPGGSGERSEILNMNSGSGPIYETDASGTQYYAVSVYLPADWTPPISNYGWYLQLHAPDAYIISPTIGMGTGDRFFSWIIGGDMDGDHSTIMCEYSKNDLALGHWVDFIFKVKYMAQPVQEPSFHAGIA